MSKKALPVLGSYVLIVRTMDFCIANSGVGSSTHHENPV